MLVVRENALGRAEFEWNRAIQKELRLSVTQVKDLEAGKVVHTPTKGGTDFYLVTDEVNPARPKSRFTCPTCGGTGRIDQKGRGIA